MRVHLLFLFVLTLALPSVSQAKTKTKSLRRPQDFAGRTCKPQERDKMMCMVCNIYFEARGESHAGKVAVGRTTLTRITRKEYPDSICGVVWQNGQFSWTGAHRGSKLPGHDTNDYAMLADSVRAAKDVFRLGPNGLANFCNPKKSSCPWRNSPPCLASRKKIGRHLFCNTT